MLGARSPVLFDLDGTLVDSAPDIATATNATLLELGYPAVAEPAVRNWVGNGVDRLLHRALTGRMDGAAPARLHARASAAFARHYARSNGRSACLYPGARDCLEALREAGLRLACITNKPARFAHDLLSAMAIEAAFELLVGGDSLPVKKPHPLPLTYAIERLGGSAAGALMVGDSSNDVRAARAAGVAVVCVSYGYNHGLDIRDADPDVVIDALTELPPMLIGHPHVD